MYRLCIWSNAKIISQTFISFLIQMQELETLLTSLIQRGRKPWGAENVDSIFCLDYKPALTCLGEDSYPIITLSNCSFRELVSLESGLWQFVCERQLCGNERGYWLRCHSHPLDSEADYSWKFNYEFRLLESALIPEEELGKFLVENIKIEWK